MTDDHPRADTASASYTNRLQTRESVWWKRVFDVQAPYRWNLRRQHLGRTLDVGCGIGRNLAHLDAGSVGVDHNATSVAVARERGLEAYTLDEWGEDPGQQELFDALLFAHIIEHMDADAGAALVASYLPWLRPGGRVMFICPQERGYASDATHIRFTTDSDLRQLAQDAGLAVERSFSFPFPRPVGRVFLYNEFCVLARKP